MPQSESGFWDILQIISFSCLRCFCAVAKKSPYRRPWRPASYNSKWDRTSKNDMFILSWTGLRFQLYKNFNMTTQYNYDWDKSPTPGREKVDEMYLFTFGCQW
ncbi:MAG: DUF481 domain-containing protein [Desulfobacteraceae bacterium]|nr:DUF481 domain-containing protein [Desulfobacteraceae bacterium]